MSFRTIRPATAASKTAESPPVTQQYSKFKRSNVTQACGACRVAKTRCDGMRPKCKPCLARERQCVYDPPPCDPQSRLKSLEKLVTTLRDSSPETAGRILEHIRSTSGDTAKPIEHSDTIAAARDDQKGKSTNLSSDILKSTLCPSTISKPAADTGFCNGANPRHSRQLASQSIGCIHFTLPDASITKKAIDSFFSCSGSLFHVFKRSDITEYSRTIFEAQDLSRADMAANVCSVMAVAAVGAQYLPDVFDDDAITGFYDIVKYFFDVVVEHEPLHAVKVCTLLAHYHVLDRATVALAYVEIGLGIARMYGLGGHPVQLQSIPTSTRIDLQKTWRTLIFFSTWLSSTLGYISGNSNGSAQSALLNTTLETPTDIEDMVQTEMINICLLKADILRLHLTFKNINMRTLHIIAQDLQDWYHNLPPVMHLQASGQEDLSTEIRRSIMHVHLLYLGAIQLLHRRIASQYWRSYRLNSAENPLPMSTMMLDYNLEASLAAATSARILKLLLEDNGIFKRCWLVVFQAYTSCTVLLHAAAQKQLHGFPSSSWETNEGHVNSCLSVLEFCGSTDRVAARFHQLLSPVAEEIFSKGSSKSSESAQPSDIASCPAYEKAVPYPLEIPANANPKQLKVSLHLLGILSQPFGDPMTRHWTDPNTKEDLVVVPTQHEYPQVVGQMDWDVESRDLFNWDPNQLALPFEFVGFTQAPAIGKGEVAHPSRMELPDVLVPISLANSFVGSNKPSGWTKH